MKLAGPKRVVLSILLFLAVTTGVARADNPIEDRRMTFAERGQDLVATFAFKEILAGKEKRIQSGLPTAIVVRLYVYESGRDLPVALNLISIRVVYDLWDETYLVRVESPLGQRTLKFDDQAEALRSATLLEAFPIAGLGKVVIGRRYFLAVVAELNPLSPELLAEVRGWLSKPTSERELGMSSAFFGSFVSIFSNLKLPPADAVIRLRSQLFYRVPR